VAEEGAAEGHADIAGAEDGNAHEVILRGQGADRNPAAASQWT
jgi:hypothetical protein